MKSNPALCFRALFILLASLLPVLGLAQTTAFSYTGGSQTYTVPSGATFIKVKAWAGGGGGAFAGSIGGGGGYAEGVLAVTAGQIVTVNIGGGGRYSTMSPSTSRDYPSVGASTPVYNGGGDTWVTGSGGHGGGRTEVSLGASLLIAGGGGGASDGNTGNGAEHGGGGGVGTGGGPTPGGFANQGGRAGGNAAPPNTTGGGGGSGWAGGGAGSWNGGAGAGSSNATGFTNTSFLSGGTGTAGNASDSDRSGAGDGGATQANATHGRVVIIVVPPAPAITSALTKSANVGSAASYTITASNTPTSFGATGLPAGLTVNTTTGVISGTPTTAGTVSTTISAINAGGTGSATLVWTIIAGAPVISSPLAAPGVASQPLTYTITATNTPTSFGATGLPSGLTVNTTTGVISGTPATTGSFSSTITATNAAGTGSATLAWTFATTVTVTPAGTGVSVINGSVGVGTSTPQAFLHVKGNVNREVARFQGSDDVANLRNFISLYSTNPGYWWEFSAQDKNGTGAENGFALRAKALGETETKMRLYLSPASPLAGTSTPPSFLRLYNHNAAYGWDWSIEDPNGMGTQNGLALREVVNGIAGVPTIYLHNGTGNVGIGTAVPSSFRLAVNGSIRAKEVVVDTGWSDFVFADDYRLPGLDEVEAHIKAEKHLPGIPSAAEVAAGGVSIGDMQSKLLQKIEELTLHVIAQEKRLRTLEAENAALKAGTQP